MDTIYSFDSSIYIIGCIIQLFEMTCELTDSDRLRREVIDFWELRAPGYSLATRLSLKSEKHLLDVIGRMVNLNQRMDVVDMGTSAGLMAIWLSEMGHRVTALDLSERMIELARKNAHELGQEIDFRLMDVQDPDLPACSYDMIVAKSVVWCLDDPVGAYENWIRLLKPGGHLVIIDGNYYLDIFDEDYRRRKEYLEMKNGSDNNLHARTNIGKVDLNIIRRLAYSLPLSRERRPTWDVSILLGLGMTDIRIRSLDAFSYSVLTENGMMRLPSTFVVYAQKPVDDESPLLGGRLPDPIDESMIESVRERVRNAGCSELTVLKAMSDATRRDIILALESGRMSVGQIADVVGSSPSLVSHHLRSLREAGIVRSLREGKEVRYAISNDYAVRTILDMCQMLSGGTKDGERIL